MAQEEFTTTVPLPTETERLVLKYLDIENSNHLNKICQAYARSAYAKPEDHPGFKSTAAVVADAKKNVVPRDICKPDVGTPIPWPQLMVYRKAQSSSNVHEFIGFVGIWFDVSMFEDKPDLDRSYGAKIGFLLLPEYASQGYGTEMTKSALKWSAQELGLKRISATVEENNIISRKLCRRVQGVERQDTTHAEGSTSTQAKAPDSVVTYDWDLTTF